MTLFPTLCLYTTSKKESQMQISILSSMLAQTVRETEATEMPVLRQTVFWGVTSLPSSVSSGESRVGLVHAAL